MTRLTFGLPVHNGERFLVPALESLQSQTVSDIRIVVSDNASTDATEEICRAAAAADERIHYHREEVNRGGIWNFRRVMQLADTELFSWMAADDVKLPAFTETSLAALDDAGPDYVMSLTGTRLIDGDGVVYEDLDDAVLGMDAPTAHRRIARLLYKEASHAMYGVIRRDALARTRGITSVLGDDMVLLVELMCQGRLVFAPAREFLQRHHDTQVSVQGASSSSWFATGSSRSSRSFVETRTNIEMYRGVAHSDLPRAEKRRCWSAITTGWVLPRWRAVARDVATFAGVDPGAGRLRAQRARQSSAASSSSTSPSRAANRSSENPSA